MSDDTVLAVITALVQEAQAARGRVITRGGKPEHFTEEQMPEPQPCNPRIYDTEILARIPNGTLQNVNECCIRLIEAEKIRLVNTNWVRVNQNGHAYELRIPAPQLPEVYQILWCCIEAIENRCRVQARPCRFIDREIFDALSALGHNRTIGEINQVCVSFVRMGKLRILGGLDWLNTQADGMTYEVVN